MLASKFNKFYAEEWIHGFPSFGCVDEDGDRRRIWREGRSSALPTCVPLLVDRKAHALQQHD